MDATQHPTRKRRREPRAQKADAVIYCRFFSADMEKSRNFAIDEGVSLHKFIRVLYQNALAEYAANPAAFEVDFHASHVDNLGTQTHAI